MIKTAFKHWIYEICINMVFDRIINNFKPPSALNLKVGDKFTYITIRKKMLRGIGRLSGSYANILYLNAEITSINIGSKENITFTYHEFSYHSNDLSTPSRKEISVSSSDISRLVK